MFLLLPDGMQLAEEGRMRAIMQSQRQYRQLAILRCRDKTKIFQLVEKFGENLDYLAISNCMVSPVEFDEKLSVSCRNLKHFNITDNLISVRLNYRQSKYTQLLLNLSRMTIEPPVLKLTEGNMLNEINISIEADQIADLMDVLRFQANLKSLNVVFEGLHCADIFHPKYCKKFRFSLERFHFNCIAPN